MENDLKVIFHEILDKMRGDIANAEIKTSAGYPFIFFHNRVASYQFSDEYKNRCNNIFNLLEAVAPFANKEINKETFFPYYVAELVTVNVKPESLNYFDQIMTQNIELEVRKILKWHASTKRIYKISILLNTDFKMNGPIDGWEKEVWDRRESALAGYRSGISDQMFFQNYVDAFWLVKEFDNLPTWPDLIELLSVLRLSLSLSVKERVVIHNVSIKYKDWIGCPHMPNYFMRRYGHIEELRTDSDTARFFLNSFSNRDGIHVFSHERVLDNNLFAKWKSIVSDQKYRSAFHHIFNGLSDILKSHNYGNFNENFIASDGLIKSFIGLDGMLPDHASRQANMKAFVNFWHPIFSQVVPQISKKKTKRIYALRCALLHGDYDDFRKKCSDVYRIICPGATETTVGTQHFAFNFASFLVGVIKSIENDPSIIQRTLQDKSRLNKIYDWIRTLAWF